MAATAEMWGAAMDVPVAIAYPPYIQQLTMSTPGAATSTEEPKLVKKGRVPSLSIAVTTIGADKCAGHE